MSSSIPSSGSSQRAPTKTQYYFAYGSNIYLKQMAVRCPQSKFCGKATLPGYRWQINSRGVANVVRCLDSSVEGVLFLIQPEDRKALDRSEGVSRGYYQRDILEVQFERHRVYDGLSTDRLDIILSTHDVKEDMGSSMYLHNPVSVEAYVYVSHEYQDDGVIREEYITRMKNAISHAEKFNISESFIKHVQGHLHRPEVPPAASHLDFQEHTSQAAEQEQPIDDQVENMKIGYTIQAAEEGGDMVQSPSSAE